MPAYQPSIFQHGEDLPLFADTLRSTRCSDCGSYLIALGTQWERCTECEAELDQEPPPCPICTELPADLNTGWELCPDCHPDNHEMTTEKET